MSGVKLLSKSKSKEHHPSNQSTSSAGYSGVQKAPKYSSSRLGAFYSAGPVLSLGVPVQAKMKVGRPGDPHEREADSVAERIMSGGRVSSISGISPGGVGGVAQRQEEEEHEDEELIQAMNLSGHNAKLTPSVESHIQAMKGSGESLPESTRAFFEPRFGRDFSRVRVHTDAKAAETAQAVNARAYTVGHNIAFGAGHYAPGTSGGQKLLAHELTHVVQQGVVQKQIQFQVANDVDNNQYELEADFQTIVSILDEWHYSNRDEEKVISIFTHWAREKYLDKLFDKLTIKTKKSRITGEYTNYYNLIFNHFDRVDEIRKIRDTFSIRYKGDDGVKELSVTEELKEGKWKETAEGFWSAKSKDIGEFLNKAGTPKIIQQLWGAEVGVIQAFAELAIEFVEGIWSLMEAVDHIKSTILYFITRAFDGAGLGFLKKIPLVGNLFDPESYREKYEATVNFFKAAGDALKDPGKIWQGIEDAAFNSWEGVLHEFNKADDFNQGRIIAKGVVKVGMEVGGFIKSLPQLAKSGVKIAKTAGNIVIKASTVIAKAIKGAINLGGKIFKGTWKVIRDTLEDGTKRLRYLFRKSGQKNFDPVPDEIGKKYIVCSECKKTDYLKSLEKERRATELRKRKGLERPRISNRVDLTKLLENLVNRAAKEADLLLKKHPNFWAKVYRNPSLMPKSLQKYPPNIVRAVIRGKFIHNRTEKLLEIMDIPGIRIEKRVITSLVPKKYRIPDIFFKVGKKEFRMFLDIKPKNFGFGPGNKQYDDMLSVMEKWEGDIIKLGYE